jgi:predicted site-specific integrase-resolvase
LRGGRANSEDSSAAAEPDVPAVAYVRMSTDHQKYSTENQLDVIRSYAGARGLQILRVFEDSGRSGLRLDGREALQNLMAEVLSGHADFKAILVYDVSRSRTPTGAPITSMSAPVPGSGCTTAASSSRTTAASARTC